MTDSYSDNQRNSKNKKVLVAMNGSISSTVAAYLLKKQGYECIGLALKVFDNNDQRYVAKPEQLPWVNPNNYQMHKLDRPLFGKFHIPDLEVVKEIAQKLEISFYAVNAQEIYFDSVIEHMVSARLAGRSFSPYVAATKTLFEVLLTKAEKLGCSSIATGHYAKILNNTLSGQQSIYTSNDMENDQSFSLSVLTQRHLKKLTLPLAEMRRDDVIKIAETLGVTSVKNNKKQTNREFMQDPRVSAIVENFSSSDLREEGDIYSYMSDITTGNHSGIHQFYLGQSKLANKMNLSIEKNLTVVQMIPSRKRVVVADPEIFYFTHCVVRDFVFPNDFDSSKPLRVYLSFEGEKEKIGATLIFKNTHKIILELDQKQTGFIPKGEFVAIYNSKGKGGRVIGGGHVKNTGFMDKGHLRFLPSLDPEMENLNVESEEDMSKPFTTKLSDDIHHF